MTVHRGTSVTPELGGRLRRQRRVLGLTLREIAGRVGITTGYLSAIETGRSVPSLPVLTRLAHALGLSLGDVLRNSSSSSVARGHLPARRGTSRIGVGTSRMHIVGAVADPGAVGDAPVPLGRTDVFVFLVQGRLRVIVDAVRYDLGAGDALHCAVPRTVSWCALGREDAISLWAASSPVPRRRDHAATRRPRTLRTAAHEGNSSPQVR